MTRDEILAEIARLGPWHHDVELEPGLRTRSAPLSAEHADQRTPTTYRPEQHVQDIVTALYPAGLEGRSFLDCACNGGGHSLTAARLGAGRCFGFDARRHWIDQAQFLKRFAPQAEMDFAVAALADLPALDLPQFDVTLFSGIFYHLPDPVNGLRLAADRTREMLILNTAAKWGPDKALRLERESPDEVMSGVDGLAWLPTGPAVLRDILAWCGFPHTRIDMYWTQGYPRKWKRLQVLAARDPSVFEAYDRKKPWAKAPPTLIHRAVRRARTVLRRK